MRLAVEVLYGLQQRSRDGLTTRLHVLRALVEDLRRSHASLEAVGQIGGPMAREKRHVVHSLARHVRAGLGDIAAETAKDVWDLTAFGSRGELSFTGLCQDWLRQAVKRWPADDLPRHRGERPHAQVRQIIDAVTRLSAHLRAT